MGKATRPQSQESKAAAVRRDAAPIFRQILALRGCRLPFLDQVDLWQDAFNDMVRDAKLRFPSLLGIHEISDAQYLKTDWRKFGYGDLRRVTFNEDTSDATYGKCARAELDRASMAGFASTFVDGKGRLRTVVMLRDKVAVGTRLYHGEESYLFKLATLAHELGHIDDFERKVATDYVARTIRLVDAEVHAELFSITELQKRNLQASLRVILQSVRERIHHTGFQGEVARRVQAEMKVAPFVDYRAILSKDLTDKERELIGEKAFAILVEYDRLFNK